MHCLRGPRDQRQAGLSRRLEHPRHRRKQYHPEELLESRGGLSQWPLCQRALLAWSPLPEGGRTETSSLLDLSRGPWKVLLCFFETRMPVCWWLWVGKCCAGHKCCTAGHIYSPSHYPNLGSWYNRRSIYSWGIMTEIFRDIDGWRVLGSPPFVTQTEAEKRTWHARVGLRQWRGFQFISMELQMKSPELFVILPVLICREIFSGRREQYAIYGICRILYVLFHRNRQFCVERRLFINVFRSGNKIQKWRCMCQKWEGKEFFHSNRRNVTISKKERDCM